MSIFVKIQILCACTLTIASVHAQPYITYGGNRQDSPMNIKIVEEELVIVGAGMGATFPDISDGFVFVVSKALDSVRFVYHTDTTDTEWYMDVIAVNGLNYVCGWKGNYCCDTAWNTLATLHKLKPDLTIESTSYFGGVYEELHNRIIPLDGCIYSFGFSGSFTTELPGSASSDPYVVKVDTNGALIWQKHPGTVEFDAFTDAVTNSAGTDFLCAGGSASQIGADPYYNGLVVKLDTAANVVWRKTYKTGFQRSEYFTCITALPDGGGVAAGYVYDENTEGEAPYLIRFNTDGDTVWTHVPYRFGEPANSSYNQRWRESEVWDVLYLSDGNFLFTGDWYNAAASTRDIFICKYSLSGDSLWRINLGDAWSDKGYAIAEDDEGYVYVACSYTNPFTTNGVKDVLLIKLDANGCTVDSCLVSSLPQTQPVSTNPFSLYPNPAEDNIRIELAVPLAQQGTQLVVRDLNSRIVFHQAVLHNTIISVESLSAGVYIAEVVQRNGERFYQRFVKQ